MFYKHTSHRLIGFFYLVMFLPLIGICQLPKTNIYMMDYTLLKDSIFFENPSFITDFNEEGYNNQPAFFSDKSVYLTSNFYNEDKTDIIKLDLSKNTLNRVTKTIESEYSPILIPDELAFTCIRVERNGTDQSLWKYPLDQSNGGSRLFDKLTNVGYHTWISEHEVALFLVDDVIKLVIGDTQSEKTKYLLDNIGRCMKVSPEGELVIVHKLLENKWYLKKYDPVKRTFKIITETLSGKEDFEILPDGSIIMASGAEIWKYNNNKLVDTWNKMDDFSDLGIENITRISASSNKILLVVNQN